MTRKDYVAIARAFAKLQPFDGNLFDQWADDVRGIADVLAADNPRFDRQRFLFACASATPSLTHDLHAARILLGGA
jgi:hypothetical protein